MASPIAPQPHRPESPLLLGDAALDDDHCEFLRLTQGLASDSVAIASARLNELIEHARRHFAAEDSDLRELRDGNASCHIDEHAAVVKSLEEVQALLGSHDIGAVRKIHVMQRLSASLHEWLPEHVREMDVVVATHRVKGRFGGVPVKLLHQPRQRSASQPSAQQIATHRHVEQVLSPQVDAVSKCGG